jgi:hypothetical protein
MTTDAAKLSIGRRDPNNRIRLDLTVREAILLYGLCYTAHAAADEEAARVLNWTTCKLYKGLRDTYRSGL